MIKPATNFPTIAEAKLPATYEAARAAIAECERVDECKTWADKAAAMRAYAVMRDDRTLHLLALRIQLRAERRMGDLLAQYPDGQQAGLVQHREAATHPTVTRVEAATAAGLSDHQRKTALRVAAVPAADFDAQVESDHPPTVTQFASQGVTHRPGQTARHHSVHGDESEVSPTNAALAHIIREACDFHGHRPIIETTRRDVDTRRRFLCL
jgi:hypothetical protein